VPSNYSVGNVLRLEIAKILEIFLVYISFAVLSNHLYIVKIKQDFRFVFENFVNVKFTFILAPKKGKNLVDYIRFKILIHITKSLSRILVNLGFIHADYNWFLALQFILSFQNCLFSIKKIPLAKMVDSSLGDFFFLNFCIIY